jgi:hypothetical protein
MRWALLFYVLSVLTAVVIVIRGAIHFDGLSLLAVALVAAALMSAFLSRQASKREMDRKYHR